MMNKKIAAILLSLCLPTSLAQAYRTDGQGGVYSFYRLSQTEGSGVTMEIKDGKKNYTLSQNDTISAGDTFEGSESCIVYFADKVTFVVEGKADFQGKGSVTYAAKDDADGAVGICLDNNEESTNFGGCTFVGVGVKFKGKSGGTLHSCTFTGNNSSIGQAALILGDSDDEYVVSHCRFRENRKAAISSAANIFSKVVIEHSEFLQNGTDNGNTPQLNLTVSDKVEIVNCDIIGAPEHNMVGGIGISNFFGTSGNSITINNCRIRENRYGIGTVGPMDISIAKCDIINNSYETNPMNGGSGISLYDPYMKTTAVISDNIIERNLWGVTIIGCKDVNLGCIDLGENYNHGGNWFINNGNNDQPYDLYNNSTNTIYAQGNLWNTGPQTEEEIEKVVFHKHDNPSLGEVIYWPAHYGTDIRQAKTETEDKPTVYRLDGIQLPGLQKGLNIVHGKKVVR